MMRKLRRAVRLAVRWLRAVSGDSAYEEFVERRGALAPRPSPRDFYLARLRRKYSGISRCC